ncbi:unnamed protein product [marine sediment metagenome]|uniref:Uncharacterized protein n=1 Tax=marine sediment metagenome TaxID=412755 RepID=X1S9U0_9ZZZZ
MTLDEAIKLLKKYRHDHHSYPTDIMGKAEQLGIEALALLIRARDNAEIQPYPLLPSETLE